MMVKIYKLKMVDRWMKGSVLVILNCQHDTTEVSTEGLSNQVGP